MEQNNPYSTPTAAVSDMQKDEGFGDLKVLTSQGRIGRVRYLMYTLGISIVGMFIMAAIGAIIPAAAPFLLIAFYAVILLITIFLTIQRCHDFNMTGWLSLVMLIPIASLIFYLIPGTKGSNKYGLQPPPNSKAIKITAFLLLAVFVLGIVAAIAIPAYQEYLVRAAG